MPFERAIVIAGWMLDRGLFVPMAAVQAGASNDGTDSGLARQDWPR
jgi:hypothetical protein